jgi:hypothetical protein
MATATNLKSALSSGANIFNDGHTIGPNAVARIQAWFEADYGGQLDGASMSADDLSAWLWRQVAGKVKNYEQKILDEAAGTADELEEV